MLPYTVSKTTKELLLAWDKEGERSAVSVAKDLRMPQFAMKRITTNRCNSQYHMGESWVDCTLFVEVLAMIAISIVIKFAWVFFA